MVIVSSTLIESGGTKIKVFFKNFKSSFASTNHATNFFCSSHFNFTKNRMYKTDETVDAR